MAPVISPSWVWLISETTMITHCEGVSLGDGGQGLKSWEERSCSACQNSHPGPLVDQESKVSGG